MTLRGQVATGLAWTACERWLTRLAGLATLVVLARLLDVSDFGLIALASASTGVLQVLAEGGFGAYLIHARRADQRITSSVHWWALGIAAALAAMLVASAPLLAQAFNKPQLSLIVMAMSPLLVLNAASIVPVALLQRDLQFKVLAIRQVAGVLAGGTVGVSTALAGWGVWALVAQLLVGTTTSSAILWIRSAWRPSPVFDWRTANEATRYGSRIVAINLATALRDQGEAYLIGGFAGTTALGAWTIAKRLLLLVVDLCGTVISTVALPAFAQLRHDRPRLVRAYTTAVGSSALLMLPTIAFLSVTSSALVPLLFGGQWSGSGDLAAILMLAGVFSVLGTLDRSVYLAIGRPGVELGLVTMIVALHIVTIAVFVDSGLVVLAWATLIRAALLWPVRAVVLRRVAAVPVNAYAVVLPPVVAAAAQAAVMYYVGRAVPVGWAALSLQALAGGLVYVAAMTAISRDFRVLARRAPGVARRHWSARP
ncbi:lipopolysaccharide biosynthesis protein [Nocardioides zhouii]|uniref:lipopolysaccharide biosynthesis protein n=1 Tax=Nocardioides zhouii TaxID=1168729 RepID=UPI0013EC76C7|nr:lipopolysaccharide biosynthesis protein [Nocardioides zhouii]